MCLAGKTETTEGKEYRKSRQLYYQSKEEGNDQESTQSSTTPDPGLHMWKWQ